jgi:hypothetical protein
MLRHSKDEFPKQAVIKMTRDELLLGLAELLETRLPLTGPEELSSLGNWYSMTVLSFICLADDKCGVSLAPTEIISCQTVNQLVELVLGRSGTLPN